MDSACLCLCVCLPCGPPLSTHPHPRPRPRPRPYPRPHPPQAFALYDADGDGYVSFGEMQAYLTNVMRVLYSAQPDLEARMGMPAEVLAEDTTMNCFQAADTNADGALSLAEFQQFYRAQRHTPIGKLLVDVSTDLHHQQQRQQQQQYQQQHADAPTTTTMTLDDVKRVTTLGEQRVADVLDVFAQFANEEGLVSRAAASDAFEHVAQQHGQQGQHPADVALRRQLAARVFSALDTTAPVGWVDFAELASAVSVLCGGTPEDRVWGA